jgi:hypothetical protein
VVAVVEALKKVTSAVNAVVEEQRSAVQFEEQRSAVLEEVAREQLAKRRQRGEYCDYALNHADSMPEMDDVRCVAIGGGGLCGIPGQRQLSLPWHPRCRGCANQPCAQLSPGAHLHRAGIRQKYVRAPLLPAENECKDDLQQPP